MLADSRIRLALIVAVVVVVVDQVTKAIAAATLPLHEMIPLLPFFALTYVRNTGAAFGILGAAPTAVRLPLFLGVTVLAAAALVSFLRSTPPDRRWLIGALGGILGGAMGNLICRVRFGEVIDFFDLHWGDLHWPMFNVADTAITLGVLLVLVHGFRERDA